MQDSLRCPISLYFSQNSCKRNANENPASNCQQNLSSNDVVEKYYITKITYIYIKQFSWLITELQNKILQLQKSIDDSVDSKPQIWPKCISNELSFLCNFSASLWVPLLITSKMTFIMYGINNENINLTKLCEQYKLPARWFNAILILWWCSSLPCMLALDSKIAL